MWIEYIAVGRVWEVSVYRFVFDYVLIFSIMSFLFSYICIRTYMCSRKGTNKSLP